MWAYIVRRILLTIPTVLGIVLLTFLLFALVARDPARTYAGKNPSEATLRAIRAKMGLDRPKWLNLGPIVQRIRAADGKLTIYVDRNHGLAPGDEFALTGTAPRNFDGRYEVAAVLSTTAIQCQRLPAAASAATAPAGEEIQLTGGRLHVVGLGARLGELFNTQFIRLLTFRFEKSMRNEESVWTLIATKGPISLAVQLPAFLITLALQLVIALYVATRRGKLLDYSVTIFTVLTLSIPTISIYLLLQWCLAVKLPIFPVAGWPSGIYIWQFAALPILAMILVTVGGGARFYRTVVLDEIGADYIRTARAKGAAPRQVLFTHVLRNVMIPVITNTVTALPFLIFGALILEQIFQIPGLGGLLVQAIFNEDRSIVMAVTYITSIAYCLALLVNDILYTVVDPRVSLR